MCQFQVTTLHGCCCAENATGLRLSYGFCLHAASCGCWSNLQGASWRDIHAWRSCSGGYLFIECTCEWRGSMPDRRRAPHTCTDAFAVTCTMVATNPMRTSWSKNGWILSEPPIFLIGSTILPKFLYRVYPFELFFWCDLVRYLQGLMVI